MKRFGVPFVFASLMFLTACPQTSTPTPREPVIPPVDPTVFPVSEISGTLPNWTAGEAYVTTSVGLFRSSSTEPEDEIGIGPPTFQSTTLSANGNFYCVRSA